MNVLLSCDAPATHAPGSWRQRIIWEHNRVNVFASLPNTFPSRDNQVHVYGQVISLLGPKTSAGTKFKERIGHQTSHTREVSCSAEAGMTGALCLNKTRLSSPGCFCVLFHKMQIGASCVEFITESSFWHGVLVHISWPVDQNFQQPKFINSPSCAPRAFGTKLYCI